MLRETGTEKEEKCYSCESCQMSAMHAGWWCSEASKDLDPDKLWSPCHEAWTCQPHNTETGPQLPEPKYCTACY